MTSLCCCDCHGNHINSKWFRLIESTKNAHYMWGLFTWWRAPAGEASGPAMVTTCSLEDPYHPWMLSRDRFFILKSSKICEIILAKILARLIKARNHFFFFGNFAGFVTIILASGKNSVTSPWQDGFPHFECLHEKILTETQPTWAGYLPQLSGQPVSVRYPTFLCKRDWR